MTANQINRVNALTQERTQAEQARHNLASEALQERDVRSNEVYRDRAGRAQLSQAAASHRQAGAAESQALTAAQRAIEEARHNRAAETQAEASLAFNRTKLDAEVSQQRANRAVEVGKNFATQLHYGRQDRETARHNAEMEIIQMIAAMARQSQAETAAARLENDKWRTLAQNVRDYVAAGGDIAELIGQVGQSVPGAPSVLRRIFQNIA